MLGSGTVRLLQEVRAVGIRAVVRALCTLGEREPWLLEAIDLQAPSHPGWAASRVALAQVLGENERYAGLDFEERLALISRITVAATGMAVSSVVGDLTDFDRAYDSVVEPIIEHALRTRPRDDLLAGRS